MKQRLSRLARRSERFLCEAWRSASRPLSRTTEGKRCDKPFCPAGVFALAGLPCGACAVVKGLDLAHEKAEQLRRMGIREGSTISLLNGSDPVVILVENTRVAVSRHLARGIRVQSFGPGA